MATRSTTAIAMVLAAMATATVAATAMVIAAPQDVAGRDGCHTSISPLVTRTSALPVTATRSVTLPVTGAPVTGAPVTGGPVTAGPVTAGPVTAGPVTAGSITAAPVIAGPDIAAPPLVRPTITVHLVDRAHLARDAAQTMMDEAARIWAESGITVQWVIGVKATVVSDRGTVSDADSAPQSPSQGQVSQATLSQAPLSGAPLSLAPLPLAPPSLAQTDARLYVIVTHEIAAEENVLKRRPLASILFVDGKPTSLIRAYPGEVEQLLESARWDDRVLVLRPSRLRHRLMGRVLGRAVAHEIGHFLFKSSDHAAQGLMRAHHRADTLLAPSEGPFRVVAPTPASCAPTSPAPTSSAPTSSANVAGTR